MLLGTESLGFIMILKEYSAFCSTKYKRGQRSVSCNAHPTFATKNFCNWKKPCEHFLAQ